MRTTVNVDDDVAAEVRRLRRDEGLGLSEALNALARRGIAASSQAPQQFRQRTVALEARVDVTNVAEVLELLDDEDRG